MISHVSPLYTVAQICAVVLIILLIVGICMIDWEMVYLQHRSRKYRRQAEKNKYADEPEWIDFDKWEESK